MADLVVERKSSGRLIARLSGNWREGATVPGVGVIAQALVEDPATRALEFDTADLNGWDSRLVVFANNCAKLCQGRHVEVREDGWPEGVRRLLLLARAVHEKADAHGVPIKLSLLQKVGGHAIVGWEAARELFTFLGQNVIALGRLMQGRAQFRWADAFSVMEQSGPEALAIVGMINFLMGLILAFVGAIELRKFGASIYVADLVSIATVRELGCIMSAIILCGRTGAAFAAQLGTMKVNEEISALQTFGISPIEFLVLPRMLALVLMMPFLCVFADVISITGGFFVSVSILDITPMEYLIRTVHAIHLNTYLLGIFKGTFFGFLVAYTGCLCGMQSGYSAAAVGQAATRAVVAGISAIIASDGIFAVLCNAMNI